MHSNPPRTYFCGQIKPHCVRVSSSVDKYPQRRQPFSLLFHLIGISIQRSEPAGHCLLSIKLKSRFAPLIYQMTAFSLSFSHSRQIAWNCRLYFPSMINESAEFMHQMNTMRKSSNNSNDEDKQ